jgi:periplasmic protein TonB
MHKKLGITPFARTALAAVAAMMIVACTHEPSKPNAPLVKLEPRYHALPGRVAIHEDPARRIRIPYELYPLESKRLGEEGSCLVRLTVGINGNVEREEISVSSGSPRLDRACLDAYRSAHFIPATENGKPVIDTVEMPANWRLHQR